jgi:hypothetical protein
VGVVDIARLRLHLLAFGVALVASFACNVGVPTSVPSSAGGVSNAAAGQDTAESELVGPLPDDDDDDEYEYEYDDDDEDRTEWVATPEETPERPTGNAEIDRIIHESVGDAMCLGEVQSGDLDGVGPKDWIATFFVCSTGEPAESIVFVVGLGNTIADLVPPGVGGYGGWPEFDRMHDGERVLLMVDSCCDVDAYGIVHLRDGQLVLGESVQGTRVAVVRDSSRRIIKLVKHQSDDDD